MNRNTYIASGIIVACLTLIIIIVNCCFRDGEKTIGINSQGELVEKTSVLDNPDIERVNTIVDTTADFYIFYPNFKRIDLVCEKMPNGHNKDVIFCAEAAFTGELLKEFNHRNIAGNHVCNGVLYKGYKCKQNTGGFIFYGNTYKFIYGDINEDLALASKHHGMGFGQQMIIHEGKKVPYRTKDSSPNKYRALCEYRNQLCIIDSRTGVRFGNFVNQMLNLGVNEALYMDMGKGWDFSWYRNNLDEAILLSNVSIPYTTNWIVFYK